MNVHCTDCACQEFNFALVSQKNIHSYYDAAVPLSKKIEDVII